MIIQIQFLKCGGDEALSYQTTIKHKISHWVCWDTFVKNQIQTCDMFFLDFSFYLKQDFSSFNKVEYNYQQTRWWSCFIRCGTLFFEVNGDDIIASILPE